MGADAGASMLKKCDSSKFCAPRQTGKRFGLAEKGRDLGVRLGSVEDRLPPTSGGATRIFSLGVIEAERELEVGAVSGSGKVGTAAFSETRELPSQGSAQAFTIAQTESNDTQRTWSPQRYSANRRIFWRKPKPAYLPK